MVARVSFGGGTSVVVDSISRNSCITEMSCLLLGGLLLRTDFFSFVVSTGIFSSLFFFHKRKDPNSTASAITFQEKRRSFDDVDLEVVDGTK